jgi:hypothetical protein
MRRHTNPFGDGLRPDPDSLDSDDGAGRAARKTHGLRRIAITSHLLTGDSTAATARCAVAWWSVAKQPGRNKTTPPTPGKTPGWL